MKLSKLLIVVALLATVLLIAGCPKPGENVLAKSSPETADAAGAVAGQAVTTGTSNVYSCTKLATGVKIKTTKNAAEQPFSNGCVGKNLLKYECTSSTQTRVFTDDCNGKGCMNGACRVRAAPAPVCDANHLNLCNNQANCTTANGDFIRNSCVEKCQPNTFRNDLNQCDQGELISGQVYFDSGRVDVCTNIPNGVTIQIGNATVNQENSCNANGAVLAFKCSNSRRNIFLHATIPCPAGQTCQNGACRVPELVPNVRSCSNNGQGAAILYVDLNNNQSDDMGSKTNGCAPVTVSSPPNGQVVTYTCQTNGIPAALNGDGAQVKVDRTTCTAGQSCSNGACIQDNGVCAASERANIEPLPSAAVGERRCGGASLSMSLSKSATCTSVNGNPQWQLQLCGPKELCSTATGSCVPAANIAGDIDRDGVENGIDNCAWINNNQADSNHNGIGDFCDQ